MRCRAALPLALAGIALAPAARAETRLDFEADPPGEPPAGFAFASTGPGAPGRWRIREDATAPSGRHVLVQESADPTPSRFPLAVVEDPGLADGTLSVRFKALSGAVDQAAGIVWRYRDAENYYLVRANALEGNVVLYKVERGKRSDLKPTDAGLLAYGKKAPVKSGAWHELRVEVKGDLFRVAFDGAHLFDVRDASFAGPGKVGLWTKADSVTAFDDLRVAPADEPRAGEPGGRAPGRRARAG
jgi:hypothetical protein